MNQKYICSITLVFIFQFCRYFFRKKRWSRRVNLWTNLWGYRHKQDINPWTSRVLAHGHTVHVYGFTCSSEHVSLLLLDESFAVSHSKRGILAMANKGPHSNGSQFYITLQPTLWMDRSYVAFGCVSQIWIEIHLFNFPILFNLRSSKHICPSMSFFFTHCSQVVEGVDVLRRIEEAPTCNERPKYDCKVVDCGIFKL